MVQYQSLLSLTYIVAICNLIGKTLVVVDARSFEYELPNRTVTICPSYSLISIECPQIPSILDHRTWQPNLPKYLISIDYIRSFPLRLGYDVSSCQPDLAHGCNNFDLRYINTLCNGKPYCSDISAYQIRDRSLCAFKAVTEIGYHCVPTWNVNEVQLKYDICQNTSLTNDYGFIYSRNFPSKTTRLLCSTPIFSRPNYKTILYFVHGELNHDQLRIESVTSDGTTIVNTTLNGNLTTVRLAESTYEMKITFIPSHVYSYHPTYFLLYFYTIPICSINDPCQHGGSFMTSTPITVPTITNRMRIQSVGWTRVPNIWIVIPIILAYVLLLLLIIVLALLFQRRRKQQKVLASLANTSLSPYFIDPSGTSSRVQLVPSMPPSAGLGNIHDTFSSRHLANISQNAPRSLSTSSFAKNMDRYYRESRSDFDLPHNIIGGIDPRHHASIPYRSRSATSNVNYRGYGTVDHLPLSYDTNQNRRSLPKSFSDCDLCKRRGSSEEYPQYFNEQDDNWRMQNTMEQRVEPRTYRDKIRERFHERFAERPVLDGDVFSSPSTTVEYSTILPRHQRMSSESNRPNGFLQHLPFEYIPNDTISNMGTMQFNRSSSLNRSGARNNMQHINNSEAGNNSFPAKYYESDNDDTGNHLGRRLHDTREIQEMSMRMNEQQNLNRHEFYHQQHQRRFPGNANDI